MKTIYLDNAATTKPTPEVQTAIGNAPYFNTAATYAGSLSARHEIERAYTIIQKKLKTDGDLVFTSGATESNNMIIQGIPRKNSHILIASGEHSSVHSPAVYLQQLGFDVEFVPLDKNGAIGEINVRDNTSLFVFGLVNSDTGYIQDYKSLVKTIREKNPKTHIHCDAVQGFCKFDFDANVFDSVSISAHKIYGPKGIGALWLKKGTNLRPIMYGGAQQDFRPGTQDTPNIVGFSIAVEKFPQLSSSLKQRLLKNLPPEITLNSINENPYIINLSLPVLGSTVQNALSERGIYVGLGSACATNSAKNRTLLAMGLGEKQTKQVLRISFGIYNTEQDVDTFIKELREILANLK